MNKIVVNCAHRETRVAVIEDGRLVELFVERPVEQGIAGKIYKGRVANVVPGMQAAFVDIGLEKNAFLYIDDCIPHGKELDGNGQKKAIQDVLKEGQEILVQVVKEPFGQKGARVTTHITIPGRYLVYAPNNEDVGVSRRIDDDQERERLREMARSLRHPGEGIIIRTAARGLEEEEFLQDVNFLRSVWKQARQKAEQMSAPALIYADLDFLSRMIRDLLSPEIDEIVIDSRLEYARLLQMFQTSIPHLSNRMKWYNDKKPIFEAYQIESEIEKALRPRVWLKNGGYIVIEQTEALTSIDVNTGKYTGGHDLEETVHKTNLEAAKEIARQLRLRDIGGMIIIDFIDMEEEQHQQQVLQTLEQAMKGDRTKSHILGLTQLGLVEMTRKKVRQNLKEVLTTSCPCCEGKGFVKSDHYVAGQIERSIREYAGADVEAILVEAHPRLGSVLIGNQGERLEQLEIEMGFKVYVKGNENLPYYEFALAYAGSEKEVRRRALPVEEGDILTLTVENQHAHYPSDGIARIRGYVIQIAGAAHLVGQKVQVQIEKVHQTYSSAILSPANA